MNNNEKVREKVDKNIHENENINENINKNINENIDKNEKKEEKNSDSISDNKSQSVNQQNKDDGGIRKKIRDYIVNKHVEIIKKSGIPPDLASLIIKIIHFRLPFDLFLAANFSSPFISLCLWIFVMTVFSFFLMFEN